MNYDFILFEQLYTVENHYKDLCVLASLLRASGYRVAFADVFKEKYLCKVDGVPHISLGLNCPKEFNTLKTFQPRNPIWKDLYYRIRKDIYLYNIIKRLNGLSNNIYIGSFTLTTPMFFMKAFDSKTLYYMWALRSSAFLKWKNKKITFYSLVSKRLYKNIICHRNLRLVVSNELIKEEFLNNVGVEPCRLIMRPERVIATRSELKVTTKTKNTLNLLFIGTLRPFKNVEFCLEALKRLNNPNISYTVAGRCKIDQLYNRRINNEIDGMSNVHRIDRFIPDEEYNKLIQECDFLILCDKKQASCASNGTMTEALLAGRPIIAPNINPFKNEVEKYGVGLLYEYGDVDSLCHVLLNALERGAGEFQESISKYQERFIISEVAWNLRKQIDNFPLNI